MDGRVPEAFGRVLDLMSNMQQQIADFGAIITEENDVFDDLFE